MKYTVQATSAVFARLHLHHRHTTPPGHVRCNCLPPPRDINFEKELSTALHSFILAPSHLLNARHMYFLTQLPVQDKSFKDSLKFYRCCEGRQESVSRD